MKGIILILVVIVMVTMVLGDLSPTQCKDERNLLATSCKLPVLYGQTPSADCCKGIRVTHFECVCPFVTPVVAAIIPVDRIVKQIKDCGRTLPHNFKCGSVTLP